MTINNEDKTSASYRARGNGPVDGVELSVVAVAAVGEPRTARTALVTCRRGWRCIIKVDCDMR